jgi:2-oxoglutaroyl-CoA hydrolase
VLKPKRSRRCAPVETTDDSFRASAKPQPPGLSAGTWGAGWPPSASVILQNRLELRGFPPLAQRSAKKLINDIEDAGLSLAIELEGQCYGRLRSSDDFREGVEAFHQKRRPEFRGK